MGSYWGEFGEEVIGHSKWTSGSSVYNISAFDNEERYVVARNDQGNMDNPCAWSRFDWTESQGELFYCQTVFAAETEAQALATEAADSSNPADGGCSFFPWTLILPR